MAEYRIIDAMIMQRKSVVVLDKDREMTDYNKSRAIVDGKSYEYTLTHNRRSIIINTLDDLIGKTLHFE